MHGISLLILMNQRIGRILVLRIHFSPCSFLRCSLCCCVIQLSASMKGISRCAHSTATLPSHNTHIQMPAEIAYREQWKPGALDNYRIVRPLGLSGIDIFFACSPVSFLFPHVVSYWRNFVHVVRHDFRTQKTTIMFWTQVKHEREWIILSFVFNQNAITPEDSWSLVSSFYIRDLIIMFWAPEFGQVQLKSFFKRINGLS